MNTLLVKISFIFNCLYVVELTPNADMYNPEINDQFENLTTTEDTYKNLNSNIIDTTNEIPDKETEPINENKTDINTQNSVISDVYGKITLSIHNIISTPKINTVLRNIGTCVVNGFMEIVSFYFPAPLIPLIASAAGMVIPFEPVVMLRRRMPVTDYRRAIKTAVNGFLNTFNVYKFDDFEDPYMTRRFNRRFMDGKEFDNETSLN